MTETFGGQKSHISYLQRKYESVQKGEPSKFNKENKRKSRVRKFTRYVDEISPGLNLKPSQKRQAYFLIEQMGTVKQLSQRSKWQTIIVGICFYFKICDNNRVSVTDLSKYQICREVGLDIYTYARISTNLSKYFMRNKFTSGVRG